MKKFLLLLSAVMLCCCVSSLRALSVRRCNCYQTTFKRVTAMTVQKVEMIPASGHCRYVEILITRRNGSKVCVNPEAKWLPELLQTLQKRRCVRAGRTSCVYQHVL